MLDSFVRLKLRQLTLSQKHILEIKYETLAVFKCAL